MILVDPHELQVSHRGLLVAHPAGHPLALENTPRRGVHARTALMAMHLLDTVAGTLALETVTLHHARRAPPLGRAGNVDLRNALEELDGEHLPHLDTLVHAPKLADKTLGLAISLREEGDTSLRQPLAPLAVELRHLATDRAAGEPARLVEKSELHGRVAVAIG